MQTWIVFQQKILELHNEIENGVQQHLQSEHEAISSISRLNDEITSIVYHKLHRPQQLCPLRRAIGACQIKVLKYKRIECALHAARGCNFCQIRACM